MDRQFKCRRFKSPYKRDWFNKHHGPESEKVKEKPPKPRGLPIRRLFHLLNFLPLLLSPLLRMWRWFLWRLLQTSLRQRTRLQEDNAPVNTELMSERSCLDIETDMAKSREFYDRPNEGRFNSGDESPTQEALVSAWADEVKVGIAGVTPDTVVGMVLDDEEARVPGDAKPLEGEREELAAIALQCLWREFELWRRAPSRFLTSALLLIIAATGAICSLAMFTGLHHFVVKERRSAMADNASFTMGTKGLRPIRRSKLSWQRISKRPWRSKGFSDGTGISNQ
ncbi:uncharacterized protein G2W53_016492 [Senna tora]|uniref:Uncharacterized protein n=1 Tax=Senna tora TaxID=362788 RepID=A0A834TMT5_9FABA|nr:uncharacterized protein G2W53_016492 [Senna tora]